MAETSPTRIAKRRTNLLTAVRNAAIDLANSSADKHGDYVAVDTWAFETLIQSINRLVEFEDQHHGP
jgi:hypothetical protein